MNTVQYVGLSRQETLQRALEIAANNIANADTAGFKIEQQMVNTEEATLADRHLTEVEDDRGEDRVGPSSNGRWHVGRGAGAAARDDRDAHLRADSRDQLSVAGRLDAGGHAHDCTLMVGRFPNTTRRSPGHPTVAPVGRRPPPKVKNRDFRRSSRHGWP